MAAIMAAPAAADPKSKDGKPVVPANPFVRAAREHAEPFTDVSTLLVAGQTTNVGPLDVPAYGYMRHVFLLVSAAGGTAGGTNAVAHEDAPWRVFSAISLEDVNGTPLVGPFSGYDLYLANKWGSYNFDCEPTNSPFFSAVDVGGNFSFMLRVPVEIAGRDALGSLANMHSNATYKLRYTINSPANIYSTPPGGVQPTVRVRGWIEAWSQPPPVDLRGIPNDQMPPALGTTQFWSKSQFNVSAGDQRIPIKKMGNLIRNIVFVFRNATPARNHTNFPDPFRIELDGVIVTNEGRDVRRHYMRERNGFAPDTGVIVLDFTHDLDYKPGNEMRDLYVPTSPATRLELIGNFGVAGVLDIFSNDVAPAGAVYEDIH